MTQAKLEGHQVIPDLLGLLRVIPALGPKVTIGVLDLKIETG